MRSAYVPWQDVCQWCTVLSQNT